MKLGKLIGLKNESLQNVLPMLSGTYGFLEKNASLFGFHVEKIHHMDWIILIMNDHEQINPLGWVLETILCVNS